MSKMLWSISTTVRNPERVGDFLIVLKKLEGEKFCKNTQIKYQILLIKERLYTPKNIPSEYRELFNDATKDISFDIAEKVFYYQNYQDPPMRGRQSVNPLNKLGFAIAKEKMDCIKITSLGDLFILPDSDISYIFFKSLLKLQFPNPLSPDFSEDKGFNTRPFIVTMHLIKKLGGLSKKEFSLFVPTLINYENIEDYIKHVKHLRQIKNKRDKDAFVDKFLRNFYGVNRLTEKQINNPFEYGDNSMRYFRLTKYFRIEKYPFGEWRIDLEPSRMKEIEQLLIMYDGSALNFRNVNEYVEYLSDIKKPELPWEFNIDKSRDVIISLINIVKGDFEKLKPYLQIELKEKYEYFMNIDLNRLKLNVMEKIIQDLRRFRLEIIQIGKDNALRRNVGELKRIVSIFKDKKKIRSIEPVEFEFMISQCLKILNDEIEIKPNCILDDDGNPIGFAPGNKADIEVFYNSFNSIFEVTLDVTRHQVYRESVPVMRHLKDFENKYSEKPAFCVFIAPRVHNDTVNYFWISDKHGFEGKKQMIIAFELEHFIKILESFIRVIENKKTFDHLKMRALFESIIVDVETENSSVGWFKRVTSHIESWEKSLL